MITETNPNCSPPLVERISEYDRLISQLKEQIREETEKKRKLEKQQRQIEKLIEAAANLTVEWSTEAIEYVWERLEAVLPKRKSRSIESSSEWSERIGSLVNNKRNQYRGRLKAIYLEEAIAVVELAENVVGQWPIAELELDTEDLTPVQEKEKELVENPAKKNTSNSFYAWQPTSNQAIATYFNLKTGRTQSAYFGANNKQRLAELETKLMRWFEGISCSVRMAQRLNYKYELKVVGWERVPNFDDTDFGWLCGVYNPMQAIGKNVKDYLCCLLTDKPEPDELEF